MTQVAIQRTHALRGLVGGIVGALATIGVALALPKPQALELLALVLAFIAAVYLGFALADGRRRETFIEIGNIGLTLALWRKVSIAGETWP